MKANPKVIYQIMVQTRLMISFGAALNLLRGGCVAVRYAACRRQFTNIKGSSLERKLLDYQTHMDILGSNLANGFAIQMTCREITEEIVTESNKQIMRDEFKLLDVLHHFTSGLKALAGEMAYNGVDEMRQACGGAGFLASSGVCSLWEDVAPYSTYEGVNVIMFQQSSRYLFKQAAKIAKGKKCTDYFEYLNEMPNVMSMKCTAKTVDEFLSWDHLVKTMATRSLYLVYSTAKLMTESTLSSKTKTNELYAMEVEKMIRAHLHYIFFMMTKKRVQTYPFVDKNTQVPLELLAKIFAVKHILKDPQSLYECGYFVNGSG